MVLGLKSKIIFSLLLIGVSAGILIDRFVGTTSASFASPDVSVAEPKVEWNFQIPNRVFIPRIGLSAAIVPAEKLENTWEVNPKDINFGEGTAIPGETGNTVIFAHRRRNLFINLNQVNLGDQIFLASDLDFFSYEVTDKFSVNPAEPWPTADNRENELTLFTCSGPGDQERLIIKAKPI